MNRVIIGTLVGVMSLVTIGTVSASEDNSLSGINKIQDPYEQCLAYVKMKGITNVDCKARVNNIQQNQGAKKEERKNEYIMRGTGILGQSGSVQQKPPHPPIGTGSVMMGSGGYMNQIKDPYEQCLAYVKMKGITNVDCKSRVSNIQQNQGPKKEDRKAEYMINGTGRISQSGSIQPKPPRLPMGTGSQVIEQQMKGLGMVMNRLTQEQRDEFMKMIRSYLESKGITLPSSENIKDMKDEMKGEIKDMKDEMKNTRKDVQNSIENMRNNARDEMRAKQEKLKAKREEMKQNWNHQDNSED